LLEAEGRGEESRVYYMQFFTITTIIIKFYNTNPKKKEFIYTELIVVVVCCHLPISYILLPYIIIYIKNIVFIHFIS